MRAGPAFALAIAAFGLGEAIAADPLPLVAWHTLDDGSSVAIEPQDAARALGRDAARCWPVATGFDCLDVSWEGTGEYSARRVSLKALPRPARQLDLGAPASGYSCSFVIRHAMLVEQVRSPSALLAERTSSPALRIKPWSRAVVERFMAQRGMRTGGYFDCAGLTRTLSSRGLTAIAGAAVTRASLR